MGGKLVVFLSKPFIPVISLTLSRSVGKIVETTIVSMQESGCSKYTDAAYEGKGDKG